jgi:hypothetical protein
MSSSSEETVGFLDQGLQPREVSTTETGAISSPNMELLDTDALLAAIDHDLGDFGLDMRPLESTPLSQLDQEAGSKHSSTATKKRRRRKTQANPNKARDERRFEVVRLRREAEDLELTLEKLKTIRSQQRPDESDKDADARVEASTDVPAVWQEICERQLARRLKVEQENAKLKKQWEEEKRVVKSIERMLFKRMTQGDVVNPKVSKHTRRTNLPADYIKRVAAFIFDELSASVEVSYREVEDVISGKGSVPTNVVTHQPLLRGGVKGMYRRLFDKRVVPFNLLETGDAWWSYWHNYRGQRTHEAMTDVVTESFGLEMNDLNTNASAASYGQQILRRHEEESRIVFVWNCYIEPFLFENEPVSGVYLLEQSHVLIRPEDPESAADESKTDECSTSISTCYVITPHWLDPQLRTDPKTSALIDFLISALSANIKVRNETVENLLLDQALHKHYSS